jgi:hypothetical protein
MGTRHLVIVYYNGQYRIAQYVHWDGDPDGTGLFVLEFLSDEAQVSKLKTALSTPGLVFAPTEDQRKAWEEEIYRAENEASRLTKELIAKGDYEGASKARIPDLPAPEETSWKTGASILEVAADASKDSPVWITNDLDFLEDQLFCEWAYVVDLEANVLEVYSSREWLKPLDEASTNRFREADGLEQAKYLPPLIARFSIDSLPTKEAFLATFEHATIPEILHGLN